MKFQNKIYLVSEYNSGHNLLRLRKFLIRNHKSKENKQNKDLKKNVVDDKDKINKMIFKNGCKIKRNVKKGGSHITSM
jgi:hypothetical protein